MYICLYVHLVNYVHQVNTLFKILSIFIDWNEIDVCRART